jgi:hypothetical protein
MGTRGLGGTSKTLFGEGVGVGGGVGIGVGVGLTSSPGDITTESSEVYLGFPGKNFHPVLSPHRLQVNPSALFGF